MDCTKLLSHATFLLIYTGTLDIHELSFSVLKFDGKVGLMRDGRNLMIDHQKGEDINLTKDQCMEAKIYHLKK